MALTVNDCLIGGATINGYSMQPALNPGTLKVVMLGSCNFLHLTCVESLRMCTADAAHAFRDRVLVDKLSTRIFTYKRGDVVVLR